MEANYYDFSTDMLKQLPRGAFLTVQEGEQTNTMTIGWGTIGFMWHRPVIMVAVRYSRYTYEVLEKAGNFSVSIPIDDTFKKELAGTGSCTGRTVDKFEQFSLPAAKAMHINSPVIGNCGIIYECRVVYKQPLDPQLLDTDIKAKFYANNDYHVLYYGEIVAAYKNK